MTIDSVVQKTGISLGIVVLFAAATWILTGPIDSQAAVNTLYMLSMVGALGGFALAMVNSFKRVVQPGAGDRLRRCRGPLRRRVQQGDRGAVRWR